MKIALVILHADPKRGGAERYTIDIANGLRARGHAVSIISTSFPVMLPGIATVHLPTPASSRTRKYKSFNYQFDAHLHIAPYDVIHAMLPINRCDVYHPHAGLAQQAMEEGHLKYQNPVKRFAAKIGNKLNRRRRAFAKVEKKLLTKLHRPLVICLSDYVKQSVQKYHQLPDSHLATLFNAVDLKKFDPAIRPNAGTELRSRLKINPTDTVALMIAQDFARKGLEEAIRGLKDVTNNPNGIIRPTQLSNSPSTLPASSGEPPYDPATIKLLVVGRDNPGPYKKMAAQLGLTDRVIFAGPTDDPHAAYRAADFFILPTHHDPCSLVVLEALAMGLPVISTKQNGATEIMTDGVHGHVLPSATDGAALAGAIRSLCDPATRQAVADRCLTLRTSLSFERHLDDLIAIYQKAPGLWR